MALAISPPPQGVRFQASVIAAARPASAELPAKEE
jgi:hypothetical protein